MDKKFNSTYDDHFLNSDVRQSFEGSEVGYPIDDDASSFNFEQPSVATAPFLSVYETTTPSTRTPYGRRRISQPGPQNIAYELDNIQRIPEIGNSYNNYARSIKANDELPKPPVPSKNPFDDDHIPVPYRYSTQADPNQQKQGGAYTPNPYQPYFHADVLPPIPSPPTPPTPPHEVHGIPGFFKDIDETPTELHRLQEMERQRRLLMTRKPRFHFTRLPFVTIIVTVIQVSVFIAELVKMAQLTGSAFQTQPYFNPMLGPSTYVLINMGARYAPCMHQISQITNDTSIQFPCANSTTTTTNVCSLPELCGLYTIKEVNNAYILNQWYRLITPIFLHAGFLHIIFNLILQITMGATIERQIGCLKYFIIYVACGIAGFLLGANFSPDGIASTGGSGALFGIMAVNILVFVYCGKKNTNLYGTKKFGLFIFIMIAEIVISLVLGLLPGMDNFSHIGGFAMGLVLGLVFLPDPCICYIDGIIVYDGNASTWQQFVDNWNPFHNWVDKIPERVYLWISVRILALGLACAYFGALITNFFNKGMFPENNKCTWCKYFNCIPVNGWCDDGDITITTSLAPTPTSTATPSATASGTNAGNSASVTATTAGTPIPSSINNPNDSSGSFKREYGVFTQQYENVEYKRIVQADSLVEQQNFGVGIGLYFIIGMITIRFMKQKRWI